MEFQTRLAMGWCSSEFQDLSFGDKRLDKRYATVSQAMLDHPGQSLPQACDGWSGAKAAYRMFGNPKVNTLDILESHHSKTFSRCSDHNVILAVQDSTYLNYDSFKSIEGMGFVQGSSKWAYKGLVFHPSLAFSPSGECLGLISYSLFSRHKKREYTRHDYMNKPITEKETYRWIQALQKNAACLPKRSDVVTIGDRESDIYEVFDEAKRLNSFFLVRSAINRYILDDDVPSRKEARISDIYSIIDQDRCFYTIDIPELEGRKAREARLEVTYFETTLKPPQRRGKARITELKPVNVWVCVAVERDPPKDEEPLKWVLVTNHPVESLNEACEKIAWYKLRWQIELFFKVMKSGFGVERTRFCHVDALEKYILTTAILSTRVMNLTYHARKEEQQPISKHLSEIEIQVLRALRPKLRLTTLRDGAVAIASLGGFLNRAGDGPPGPVTMWRGVIKLAESREVLEKMTTICG